MQEGKNLHTFIEKPLTEKLYENERFIQPRTLSDRLQNRIRFLVVMKGTDANAKAVTLKDPVKITSDLLYIAQTSNTLGNALRELFRKPFGFSMGGKKLLFIGVIGAVAVLIYLVYSGNIKIPGF